MAYILPFSSIRLKSSLNIKDYFGKSISQEDLVKDMSKGLYIYQCHCTDDNFTDTGFFSLIKLEELESGIISIEKNCKSNIIHGTYQDDRDIISKKIENIISRNIPRYDFTHDGINYKLWVLNDSVTVDSICEDFICKKIDIVSGGDLYLEKLSARNEAREKNAHLEGGETTMIFLSKSCEVFHTPPTCLLKETFSEN